MRRLGIGIAVALTLGAGRAHGQAPQARGLAETYRQLLHPQLNQAGTVENVGLHWHGLDFTLVRGRMAQAVPADGRITAAVFEGQGLLVVQPANAVEMQQMRLFRGRIPLREPFTQAVFRFADPAAWQAALGGAVHFAPAAGPMALQNLIEDRAGRIEGRGDERIARLLLGVESPPSPLLLVDFKTADGKWVEANYDPLAQEAVEVHYRDQRPGTGMTVFDDVWTRYAPGGTPTPAPWRLDNYDLKITIPAQLDMQAQAAFQLIPARELGAALLLTLDSNLRVTAARADGAAAAFLQPKDPGRQRDPWYEGDWLYLELPKALRAGTPVRLEIEYHGKRIVTQVGPGNFFCRSFGWYPASPFGPPFQRASFDLHFSADKKYTVVATGERVRDVVAGRLRSSDFHSSRPLTVAGFALGDFNRLQAPVTLGNGQTVQVEVYTNNQMPDSLQSLSMAAGNANIPVGDLDPKRLGPRALEDAGNALKFMENEFGPYPYPRLAITPIEGSYGQGWPGLLYLSSLSFLDSTALHTLGMGPEGLRQLSETFRAHEISHQWWGHRVSWATPDDQWLSEGFANASALLYEESRFGAARTLETLLEWRRDLLQANLFSRVAINDGPPVAGERLSSTVDPAGYETVVYDKGAYVLYMLRQMLMNTTARDPDAEFRAMMRDFTQTYADGDVSTADFQHMAEKHMTAAMDLDGNRRLDWFFNQYVYGVGVCHLTFASKVAPAPGGGYQMTLTVDNPEGWRGLLPVYTYRDKSNFVRGLLRVDRPHVVLVTPLTFEPVKITANAMQDMLVEVRQ